MEEAIVSQGEKNWYCSSKCCRIFMEEEKNEHQNHIRHPIPQDLLKLYTFLDFINKGGFGCVFKVALKSNLKEILALKLITEQLDDYGNIKQECNILKQIQHPNIIKFIDSYSNEGHYTVIVTEFIGESLRMRLDNMEKPLTLKEIVKFALQINQALDYLHQRQPKIVHADIKPENILVDGELIKLIDFGISHFIKDQRTYVRFASENYMAPEMKNLTSGLFDYNEKIDMYSFGLVMHEMVYGFNPNKKSKRDLGEARTKSTIRNQELAEIIKSLLEEDPKKRADTKEVQVKLEKILEKPEKSDHCPDDGGKSTVTVTSINLNSQPNNAEYKNIKTETYDYKGETLNGKRHGNGICRYFEDNSEYEGNWKMGKRDGHGKLTYQPNCYYEGEFLNGKFHGEGTFLRADGQKYIGKWRNGQINGEGTMMDSNGKVKYTGKWKNGQMDGIGTYWYSCNAIYHGPFVNGKNEGMLGELTHPNGEVVHCIIGPNIKFRYERNVIELENVVPTVTNSNQNQNDNNNVINVEGKKKNEKPGKKGTTTCSKCTLI